MKPEPIMVTRPTLPPLEEFLPHLRQAWESRWLTNGGPLSRRLEAALADHLGVKHLSVVSNGTAALILALRALGLRGEVVTTPFSFVATAHAIRENDLTPAFTDIDGATFNLDPHAMEAGITPRTSAIVPVHCFGAPCDLDGIAEVAARHRLKVVYDAAHAFGVKAGGQSVLHAGDLSILSFHATKVFNTVEGGAIVCQDAAMKERIDSLRNFGFDAGGLVHALGTNAKMNEISAGIGLANLRHVDAAIQARGKRADAYRAGLRGVAGIQCREPAPGVTPNHAYFPILVDGGYPLGRDGLFEALQRNGYHSRKYFHPLITDFPLYAPRGSAPRPPLPVATAVAQQVLCLPLYPDLPPAEQQAIIAIIRNGGEP